MVHSSHWMSLNGSVSSMELHGHITSAPYHSSANSDEEVTEIHS